LIPLTVGDNNQGFQEQQCNTSLALAFYLLHT